MGKKSSFTYQNKNIDIIIELVGGNKGIAKKLVFESLKIKNMLLQLINL